MAKYRIIEVEKNNRTKFYVQRSATLLGITFFWYTVNVNFFAKEKQAERFIKRRVDVPKGMSLEDVEIKSK